MVIRRSLDSRNTKREHCRPATQQQESRKRRKEDTRVTKPVLVSFKEGEEGEKTMEGRVEEYLLREYAIKSWLEEVLCVEDLTAFAEEGEGTDLSLVLQVRGLLYLLFFS